MARTVFSGGGAGEAGGTAGAPQVPGSAGVLPGTVPRRLVGGVVAYNEEQRLERAVRSLLDQELPAGVEWDRIWIVASGCTDGTVTAAQALARKEPRLALLVEPRRNGKAAAIGRILERAQGDALVLLNSDAEAERGAVRELWTAAAPWIAPYAVMGRPVPTADASGPWRGPLELMWDLHHEFHRHLQEEEGGAHLSDELLLVSLNPGISLPPGVINDGSYLGVWLAGRGGRRIYASDARVRIEVHDPPEGPPATATPHSVRKSPSGRAFGSPPVHPDPPCVRASLGRGTSGPHLRTSAHTRVVALLRARRCRACRRPSLRLGSAASPEGPCALAADPPSGAIRD